MKSNKTCYINTVCLITVLYKWLQFFLCYFHPLTTLLDNPSSRCSQYHLRYTGTLKVYLAQLGNTNVPVDQVREVGEVEGGVSISAHGKAKHVYKTLVGKS